LVERLRGRANRCIERVCTQSPYVLETRPFRCMSVASSRCARAVE
jgi:hypothetical protein